MALTGGRWLAIFVLACAAVVVWQAPPRPDPRRYEESRYVSPLGLEYGWPTAAARLEAANLHLRLLEIRDSAFGPRVVAAAKPGLTVLTDPAIPDSIGRSTRSGFDAAWARYDAGTRGPVLVAVVTDTSKYNEGLPMSHANPVQGYTFPPDSATTACRVLVRVTIPLRPPVAAELRALRNRVVRALTLRSTNRAMLGPCALYATFGAPGPRVAQWLATTGWESVQDVDWTRPSPIVQSDLAWQYALYGGLGAWLSAGGDESWLIRSFLSSNAIACVGGETARCSRGLEADEVASKDARAWRARVIDARNFGLYRGWYSYWDGHFGPAESWLVSDMVRDLGRERFAAFWSSPAGLDTAFAQATGAPLGRWVQRWARRQYGGDELGPWISVRTRWAGLVVVLAGFLVAVGFAREQQAG
jgi:hypothetical protein